MKPLSPVQWAAIAGSIVVLAWSVPGLFLNPDFSVGDAATSERVLGADMNGWHALSGFLVAVPGLLLLTRPPLLAVFLLLSAGGLIATAVWALFSTQVAGGLFSFPNNEADAVLHFAVSAIFLAGASRHFLVERRPVS
jgi:hypothetical protein